MSYKNINKKNNKNHLVTINNMHRTIHRDEHWVYYDVDDNSMDYDELRSFIVGSILAKFYIEETDDFLNERLNSMFDTFESSLESDDES